MEIKFRCWHKGVTSKSGKLVHPPQMIYDSWPGECLLFKKQGQDVVVMQYAGHKDKNGKEIYEGDICNGGFGRTYIVKYSDHFCRWQLVPLNEVSREYHKYEIPIFDWVYPEMELEVIGNIHDNPEVLAVQP